MKVSFAALSAALLVAPITARGRGKSAETATAGGKGKSAAVEEENPCECSGPITTMTLTEAGPDPADPTGATPLPITTLQQAVSVLQKRNTLTTGPFVPLSPLTHSFAYL